MLSLMRSFGLFCLSPEKALDEARFRRWVEKKGRKRCAPEKVLNSDGRWVKPREPYANVYELLERYLKDVCGGIHCAVGIDWMAWEPAHRFERGVWQNYTKHPHWFKRWVREHGKGKYGDQYRFAKS